MGTAEWLGEFEQLVLWTLVRLRREGAYGMAIRRDLEERTGRSVSIGAVYATLDRLEEKGMVKTRTAESIPERGGRARRYFEIRAAGVEALNESRRVLMAASRGVPLPVRG